METKVFEMAHVCGNTATETTVALFNTVKRHHKDDKGTYVWTAYGTTGSKVITKKEYI